MPDDDFVYTVVVFTRCPDVSSDGTSLYRCPPTEEHGSKGAAVGLSRSERRWVVVTMILTLLLAAAMAALAHTYLKNIETKRNLEKLQSDYKNLTKTQQERNQFNVNSLSCPEPTPSKTNSPQDSCRSCDQGWVHDKGKCYLFTKVNMTWSDSRDECRKQGGDLVVIESGEEQRFLEKKLRNLMEFPEDKFWIGLTDSENEKTWKWVDGTSLKLEFWLGDEPDNWTGENLEGEDCVRMGEKDGAKDLKCWTDKACSVPHKSICEKILGRCPCV